MKRREFIKQSLSVTSVVVGAGYASFDMLYKKSTIGSHDIEVRASQAVEKVAPHNPLADEGMLPSVADAEQTPILTTPEAPSHSRPAESYQQLAEDLSPTLNSLPVEEFSETQTAVLEEQPLAIVEQKPSAESVRHKVANFESNFSDDVILNESQFELLVAALERINRVQDYVGFGNFNVLSLDEALAYAKRSPRIGAFTPAELEFMEMLFHYEPSQLGFFGDKVVEQQTNVILKDDVVKVPGTGHYVYRGFSEDFYHKIRAEVGDTLILTSGVRNVVKQSQLFMSKTVQAAGNLSRASRSLAPPGHSYHSVGDFDVGQVGAGLKNFTAAFAQTDEFKKLQDLGYVRIRYTANNDLGVRYEPWHIRVV